MGRFSCFYGHVHSHKQKKPAQPSFEEAVKMLQLGSNDRVPSAKSITPTAFQKLPMVEYEAKSLSCDAEQSHGWKSDELKCECHAEGSTDSMVFGLGNFRRSLSVGCELNQKGRMYDDDNTDDCIDQEYFCDSLHDCKAIAKSSSPNSCTTPPDQNQEAELPMSPHLSSSMINHESNFSVDEPQFLEKGDHEDTIVPLHTVCADNTGGKTDIPSMISKSYSVPNFGSGFPSSPGNYSHIRNRSFEDLNMLDFKNEDTSAPGAGAPGITQLNQDDNCCKFEKFDGGDAILDRYDSYNYSCLSKDWIVPVPDEIGMTKHEQTEFPSHHLDHHPNVDFKIKRIEDWVIDLQHCSSVEETEEMTDSCNEAKRDTGFIDGLDAARVMSKVNPGMEAAKKYISSLNATASTAHLANHGLVVVPLLSAFVALKALNLSGNSIVRITAGALPRGLHMLNLSKNKISAIEGLKELTRLRALDLSYNKISRIGHGLASCSSLKELYLAGNKISEVEGLHRLLKLSVLDLRFNKIATSKCLGQLAANYNSLQAISLEGNPAQKNVGDEQLKKYLQSLLPHLAYYNRQHIKSSTLKDSSDRSVRLGISAHQFDRGLRSDHKSSPRRGSPAGSSVKRSSSSHGQKGLSTDSPKQSRGRHLYVPPSGSRTSHHHHFEMDRVQSLRAGLSMHKSRSESTLAGLQNSPSAHHNA